MVLHLGSREYFTVSETGLALLEALRAPRTLPELVDALLQEYDVTPEHAAASAREFLDRCLDEGLLHRSDEG